MPIRFPHANNYEVDEDLFVAAWKTWFERFGPQPGNWRTDSMPLLKATVGLEQQLAKKHRFSLDVMCRFVVPWSYRNTMQATRGFMVGNAHVLEPLECTNPITGKKVDCARILESARKNWVDIGFEKQQGLLADAEALIEADVEVGNSEPSLLAGAMNAPADEILSLGQNAPRPVSTFSPRTPDEFLSALVAEIEEDSHQPMYRRKPHGPPVKGWGKRLEAYFWPRPRFGYQITSERLSGVLETASRLSAKVDENLNWTNDERREAVEFCFAVFEWGGVPQPRPSVDDIRRVFESALSGVQNPGSPLNSGWTKVAAFATAHLEQQACRHPLAVWDSRVATSITSRLDRLFVEAGVRAPDKIFPDIGTVGGRGGDTPSPTQTELADWISKLGLPVCGEPIDRKAKGYAQ